MSSAQVLVQAVVIAIGVGILAQLVAHRARLPSIVFLLLFGVLVGPDVLGWIDTARFGAGLPAIVSVAVALILFEGGLQLHYLDLAAVGRAVRNLVTIGAAVTMGGAALAAHLVAGFDWPLALLFGAIVTVTGPTVINPLLDRVHVVRRVDTVLRGEGILIDPIGAILALVVLELVMTTDASVWSGLGSFVSRMAIGVGIGVAGGWLIGRLLRFRGLIPDEIKNLVVLAWVLVLFVAAQTLAHESGLAAVVIAGMAVRRESIPQQHLLRRFKGELSVLLISLLFILLSAHLPLATLKAVGWAGVVTVALLMWVVRPLAVLLSTPGSSLSWRERLFLMWVSPRGVVAISISSFIAILLQNGESGGRLTAADGEALLALVFMTIAITVIVQGTTAPLMARLMGLGADEGGYAIVIGADRLGRTLGRLLKEHGWEPLLIDTNRRFISAARRMGLPAIAGNCLDREVLEEAQVESASVLVATTTNQEINVLVARLAGEEYRVGRVYPLLVPLEEGVHEGLVEDLGGDVAFGRRVDAVGWNADLRAGRANLERVPVEEAPGAPLADLDLPDDALPLLTVRGDRGLISHAGTEWQENDTVVALVRGDGGERLAELLRPAAGRAETMQGAPS